MTTALVITTEVTEFRVKDIAREVSDSLTKIETAAMKRSHTAVDTFFDIPVDIFDLSTALLFMLSSKLV